MQVKIRASSLNNWTDCARRVIADSQRHMVESRGYQLHERAQHIGASVGTAVHKSASVLLQDKIIKGELGSLKNAVELGIDVLRTEIDNNPTIWDILTHTKNTAERQVQRMAGMYRSRLAPKIAPSSVERRLEADLKDGFTLSGQADVFVETDNAIRDLKTGKRQYWHAPQLGAYSLLVSGLGKTITKVVEDFVPRSQISKPQEEPISKVYDTDTCIRASWQRANDMKEKIQKYIDDPNADPFHFPANPQSTLCSRRFCTAFHTNWCPESRMKKG